MSPNWHEVVERAVDRNPVAATLIRIGLTDDTDATLNITPIQFRDAASEAGGNLTQHGQRWMVPARRLEAEGFPVPMQPGDMILIPTLGLQARIEVAEPGFAGGEIVRWDLTIRGPAV